MPSSIFNVCTRCFRVWIPCCFGDVICRHFVDHKAAPADWIKDSKKNHKFIYITRCGRPNALKHNVYEMTTYCTERGLNFAIQLNWYSYEVQIISRRYCESSREENNFADKFVKNSNERRWGIVVLEEARPGTPEIWNISTFGKDLNPPECTFSSGGWFSFTSTGFLSFRWCLSLASRGVSQPLEVYSKISSIGEERYASSWGT